MSAPISKPISVALREHQVKCFAAVLEHCTTHTFHSNNSPTGAGKTPFNIKLAQKFDLFPVVAGPANVEITGWDKEMKKYNMNYIFLSYTKLGLLEVYTHPYVRVVNGKYEVTDAFKELIKRRILFIMDESQDTKNDNSKSTNACYAMCAAIRAANNGSRIVTLSATPFDKEEQIETYFKMMGVMTAHDLFYFNLGYKEYYLDGYGYSQIVDYCRKIDPVTTANLELRNSELSAAAIRHAVFEMFVQIIKPKYSFAMPRPKIEAKFIPRSMYYKVPQNELISVRSAISKMGSSAGYDNGEITGPLKMGMITKAYIEVEKAKAPLFTRIIKKELEADKYCKVIMFVWQNETVDILMENLKEYKPLRCDGKVNPAKRAQYQDLFQQPNTDYRLIIAKPTAFGVGINLDDTDGRFKRHTFININYNFTKTHQAAGRPYRADTKSDVTCTLVQVADTEESGIINAIKNKKNVTKKVVAESAETQVDNHIIYPGEYPIMVEN